MSLDRSLKGKNMLLRHRNVLTRAERVEHLKEMEQWTDDLSVIGLPKVTHRKAKVGKKEKAEDKTESTEEGAAAKEQESK